ncbi:MAG: reverse transcriptase/maturase family protein [Spirochaetaceae bacterium]|jgi:retron-type reverse transcriptase|nr:reverse transcriptase/maturase family protein [Spirochaetaceae bacterium]
MSELWARVYDFENLYHAAHTAAEDKKYKPASLRFFQNLEENLIEIQNELIWKTYRLGDYNNFRVRDPKPRDISALPFRDRVVQIALCNVIEPIFDTRFIYDTYACRKGKGTIAAANRVSYFLGKPDAAKYLKLDVAKYFYSINIDTLENIIKTRYINDEDILWLIDVILRHDYHDDGIKIGNRFSQLAANAYLAEIDFFAKVKNQLPYYVRYMDDIVILGNSKRKLHIICAKIEKFMNDVLDLKLNDKTKIDDCKNGIDFVGYRIFPKNKIIKKQSMNRTRAVFRAWRSGKMSNERFLASMGSRCGHAIGTSSYQFYIQILLKALRVALAPVKDKTLTGHL